MDFTPIYMKLGEYAENPTVSTAMDILESKVEAKGLEEPKTSSVEWITMDDGGERIEISLSWFDYGEITEDQPEFSCFQFDIGMLVDLKEETYQWSMAESNEGGTGTVIDIEEMVVDEIMAEMGGV